MKWNFSLLVRGVFALNYERELNDFMSIEVGAGLTYRDRFFEEAKKMGINESNYPSGINTKMGYYLEAGLRFFPYEDVFEGVFISPLIRYRTYNIKTQASYYNMATDVGYNMTELGLIAGFITELPILNLSTECYIGGSYVMSQFHEPGLRNIIIDNNPFAMLGFKLDYPF